MVELPQAQVERLTEEFYAWEIRGRGWVAYPYRVPLEPPFRPFIRARPLIRLDDGRRPTLLSSLVERFTNTSSETLAPEAPAPREPIVEPIDEDGEWDEYRLAVPPDFDGGLPSALGWLRSLATLRGPVSFELLADGTGVIPSLASRREDAGIALGSLHAYFPSVHTRAASESLQESWEGAEGDALATLECGLGREFMLPLVRSSTLSPDPLIPLVGALGLVRPGERGLLQVLFAEARDPWAQSVAVAVQTSSGEPFFADAPEITRRAAEKIASPLFAVSLRLAAKAASLERAWEILRGPAGGLAQFGSPQGNEFIPLFADEPALLEADVLTRQTHRSGMLLSADELVALVHLPGRSVASPALWRSREKSKAPPEEACGDGVLLGVNTHLDEAVEVRLGDETRTKHVHVIGASGTGKSTLLVNLILEDMERGAGLAVIDPHGDLVEEILGRIPRHRRSDVILFDPADEKLSVGWNMLEARSESEKLMLSSDLVAVFRRLSTSWGDQMTAVLGNAILTFLESKEEGNLLDLRRFLIDAAFRREFLETVDDEHLTSYWHVEFPMLLGRKPQAPILTRLDTFLRSKLVRRLVTAPAHTIDFRKLTDSGGIFLGKLAQGAIGEENAALLGSLLVSKFHQVTLARQDQDASTRRLFSLYLDEVHETATQSMARMFSGARKFGLGLVVAHQDLYQLHAKVPEVERAILANAYTRICFRVSDEDARTLSRGYATFDASDLTALGLGEALCRLGRNEDDFNLATLPLPHLEGETLVRARETMRISLRERFPAPPISSARSPEPEKGTTHTRRNAPHEDSQASPKEAPATPRRQEDEPPKPPERRMGQDPNRSGRGGPEHTYLQSLIKQWGEDQGFRATLEKPVDGGRVDIALEREGKTIACEIAVSSTVDREVAHVETCLAAGFDEVAVIVVSERLRGKIQQAISDRISTSDTTHVSVLAPEEMLSFLEARSADEETVAGYTVKVHRKGLGEQTKVRKRAVMDVVIRSLRRLKGNAT